MMPTRELVTKFISAIDHDSVPAGWSSTWRGIITPSGMVEIGAWSSMRIDLALSRARRRENKRRAAKALMDFQESKEGGDDATE